jgi:hypothetical protein
MEAMVKLADAVVMVAWIFIGICVAVAVLAVLWALGHRVIDALFGKPEAKVLPMRTRKAPKDLSYHRPNGAA